MTSCDADVAVAVAAASTAVANKAQKLLNTIDIPIAQQASALSLRIQRQCKTPAEAVELLRYYSLRTTTTPDGNNENSCNLLDWEEALFATLQLCGKTKDYQQAIRIVEEYCPRSDRCRSLAIVICGRCQQIEAALNLLQQQQLTLSSSSSSSSLSTTTLISTPAPYNAAIAACGTNRAWKEALEIVYMKMPRSFVTSLTCNAVLMALVKCRQSVETLTFLRQGFDDLKVARDRRSYHHAIAVLLSQGKLNEAVELVETEMIIEGQTNIDAMPNQETYDRLISTLSTKCRDLAKEIENNNEEKTFMDNFNATVEQSLQQQLDHYSSLLQQVRQSAANVTSIAANKTSKKRKRSNDAETELLPSDGKRATYPTDWGFCRWKLPKWGKGKTAFWKLGILTSSNDSSGNNSSSDNDNNSIIVGLHPNRNPSKNGIQLWLFRECKDDGSNNDKLEKLGFLLMINTPDYDNTTRDKGSTAFVGSSQFLGVKVTDEARREGLAKIFVALWLQCCLDANLRPTTGRMNKPLLCLVLQHTFQFVPVELSGGVQAKILPRPSCTQGNNNNNDSSVVRLTTASAAVRNLAGVFSPRDMQEQNIELLATSAVSEEDRKRSRTIVVGGILKAPENLEDPVTAVLQDRWRLSPEIMTSDSAPVSAAAASNQNSLTMTSLFLGV